MLVVGMTLGGGREGGSSRATLRTDHRVEGRQLEVTQQSDRHHHELLVQAMEIRFVLELLPAKLIVWATTRQSRGGG